jgi:DNA repair protein RadA/Sms
MPRQILFFGELGLSGEIRAVSNGQARLNDAVKHGFTKAMIPKANTPKTAIAGLQLYAVATLAEALAIMLDW